VIKSEDYQLKTRRMNYEHEGRVIFTNAPVKISGEAVSLSAQSITYDLNLNKISLAGNVEVAISKDFADLPGMGDGEQ
jgi:lipopolysaccharide assembly outer membrane protein LptD (OstA)